MPEIMQNLVVFMGNIDDSFDISLQIGNMYLNRFLIEEDAGFEISGIYRLALDKDTVCKGKENQFEEKQFNKCVGQLTSTFSPCESFAAKPN